MRNNTAGNNSGAVQTPDAELLRNAELLMQLDALKTLSLPEGKTDTQPEVTINLVELMYFLLSKLHFVLIGMLVGAIALGLYAANISVPVYTATAKLYIVGQNDNSLISMADLQMGSALTKDYQEVFKTWEVHAMVNEQLGTSFAYSTLQNMLTVRNPSDTRLLYIIVENTDPQMAADIANAYTNAAKRFIASSMDSDEPRVFSVALVPTVASSISVTNFALRGFLLGTVLTLGILVLIFLLDSRPKSTDDIMQYAGIPTLAVIPANVYLSGKGKRNRRVREDER